MHQNYRGHAPSMGMYPPYNNMWNYSCRYAVPPSTYMSGLATGTTSSLTPTTLSNIEQTFIELQSVPVTTMHNLATQSGFVPPVVDINSADSDYDGYSDSSSDPDWSPADKKFRTSDGSSSSNAYDLNDPSLLNPARKTHRRARDEKLAPEEEEKRRVRRERNKVAAAKCRQRRVDHTNRLLAETEKLENEQSNLENEIQTLQQTKDQLEFILQAHHPLCKVNGTNKRLNALKIKKEPEDTPTDLCTHTKRAATTPRTSEPMTTSVRPSTLPLIKREIARAVVTETGINITTPSSGFYNFSLDTMVDHTGLTPLTGTSHTGLTPLTGTSHTGLTPLTSGPATCSSEVQRSASESSDSGTSTSNLISL
ncbi:hypothetical protein ACJMK2_037618 [Sinanodonta woodiana]|uniref:BZIP domain-containing protein n=1 Tax=Sinanodonta woodiana TaxID=1069815 RepID=A0ABD3WLD9_SINWO